MTQDPGSQMFIEEAQELLVELESALLELETSPEDMENVAKSFRSLHTIKGSGAMFGYDEIARFTHDVETIFDRVRNGELSITSELLTLALEAKDHLYELLELPPPGTAPEMVEASDALLAKFAEFLPKAAQPAEAAPSEGSDSCAPDSEEKQTYWIRFKPAVDTLVMGARPLGLLNELDELGFMRCQARAQDIPSLDHPDFSPVDNYFWWDMILTTTKGADAISDVFIFVQDDSLLEVHKVLDGAVRGDDMLTGLEKLMGLQPDDPLALKTALTEHFSAHLKRRKTPTPTPAKTEPPKVKTATSIRVDSSRLDKLVNMVGEMVIIQSRLSQAVYGAEQHKLEHLTNEFMTLAKKINHPKLNSLVAELAQENRSHQTAVLNQIAEDLERLTGEMRDNALGLRMLPIGTTYNTFRRLVRDLANQLGKEIELITDGEDTELDKTVIDQLKDPLMHILRNALDHGVGTPQEREAVGKPRTGHIYLSARHSAGEVLISVSDDGKGIDPERIRQKGVERGLISQEAELSRKQIFDLMFQPGFSTAQKVTDVSGRGVGMDVAKRSIDSLRGTVDIESELGKGTVFTIRLPLTLAIMDGFNVLIGEESYIVPLTAMRGFQERFIPEGEPVKPFDVIDLRGAMTPCISLRKLLDVPGDQPDYERIVLTEADGTVVGLTVDQVLGRQQAVIKSLDESFKHLKWVSGTTINGDGTISLILDVPQLVRHAEQKSNTVLRQ